MAESISAVFRDFFQSLEESEKDKSKIYREVGRAIVSLSVIEESMAGIFVVLSKPMTESEAGAMFYESQSIPHKLKLVDYALMRTDWSFGIKHWPGLKARIAKQKFIRNDAAHSSLSFKYEKEVRKWFITLRRQEFDKKKGELNILDIQAAATDLEDIARSMGNMLAHAIIYSES